MTGQLQPGDQLESVKSLSQRVKVNPMTISKAYGMLVQEGVAERRRGVGMFISAVESQTAEKDQQERDITAEVNCTNRIMNFYKF